MKCIIIESSPERIAAKPVTNEDGTPAIYATIREARAELRGNGYSYNRANDRYYIKGTEYRAYIIREDSEEYASIIEQAIQDAAPEYIETVAIQTVAGNTIYRSVDPVTSWTVFTVAGRDFWELAEARNFAQCNPASAEPIIQHTTPYIIWEDEPETMTPEAYAAEDAALSLIGAYAEAIGERPLETDPETIAAYHVAARDIAGQDIATAADIAMVDDMVQAIADSARRSAEPIITTANEYGEAFSLIGLEPHSPVCHGTVGAITYTVARADGEWVCELEDEEGDAIAIWQGSTPTEAYERAAVEACKREAMEEGNCEDAVNHMAYYAFFLLHASEAMPDSDEDWKQLNRLMRYATELVKRDGPTFGIEWEPYQLCEDAEAYAAFLARHAGGPDLTKYDSLSHIAVFDPAPRQLYERYQLDAFLGEYLEDYDVAAIEAEATELDPQTGARYWKQGIDLAAIAERHDLTI